MNGINDKLKQLMITQKHPENLNDLIILFQKLDTRQQNVQTI